MFVKTENSLHAWGDWAGILAPFLTGEAQRVCRDLTAADARGFGKLKAAILASQGYSLPARAPRYHAWTYCTSQPPWAQVAKLVRRTHSWLSQWRWPTLDRETGA